MSGRLVSLPDCFPLRPLAGSRRIPWRAVWPERKYRAESVSDAAFQLRCGEEMYVEPGFRATEVTDGEAAVVGCLGALVIVADVSGRGVDADAQQASGRDVGCGPGQVIVGLAASAVLEDLDPDDHL